MAAAAAAALAQLLRAVRYPARLPQAEAASGSPAPLLPALGWLLCRFSKHVAALVAEQGLQLAGASDLRFVEGLLKFAREGLGLRPALSTAQFLSQGFAERKLELACDIVRACKERHNAAARQERLAALKGVHTEQRLYCTAASGGTAAGQLEERGQGRRQQGGKASCTLKPPPQVRVVGAAQQQQLQQQPPQQQQARALAKAGNQAAADGAEVSPEGSEADGSLTTPTSVVAAASLDAAAPGFSTPASAPLGMLAAKAPPASPAEQPRRLPQPLLQAPAPAPSALGSRECARPWPTASVQPGQLLLARPGACATDPGGCAQAALQQQHADPHHAEQTAASHPHLASAVQPAPGEHHTRQLIEELQLRLSLAQESAAAAGQEAQQAREQLQARVTVLEGRVRFLEAGFELAPALHGQPLLIEGCGARCACAHRAQPPALLPAPPARHAAICAAAAAGHAALRLPAQHGIGPSAAANSLEQLAKSNPLFDAQPSSEFSAPLPHPGACPRVSTSSRSWAPGAAAGSQGGTPAQTSAPVNVSTAAAAATSQWRAATAAGPAEAGAFPATLKREHGSTAELIAGMQARFSEAEGFLLSLQRL
ncbi:hypothetical protein ABPG77_005948 [Micractinium sp. CCAP 211/92]